MALPSPEQVLVQWAKTNSVLNGILSGRVATRLPAEPTFPFLVIQLIGGGIDTAPQPNAHISQNLMQFDAFAGRGNTRGFAPDYATADNLILKVQEQLQSITEETVTGYGIITGTQLLSSSRIEEGDTGYARYTLDAFITMRGA
tara:strand:- start:314 stop:745 length:432 start_codon:yes stop_codon:yes gene_type:complete